MEVLSKLREASSSVRQHTQYPHPHLVSKVDHQPMKFNQRTREAGTIHAHRPDAPGPCCCQHALQCECITQAVRAGPRVLEKTGSHAENKQSSLLNFPHSLIFYTTPQLQGRFLFFFLENIETGLGSQSLEPTKWEDFNKLFILLIYLCFSVSTWTRIVLSISSDL